MQSFDLFEIELFCDDVGEIEGYIEWVEMGKIVDGLKRMREYLYLILGNVVAAWMETYLL